MRRGGSISDAATVAAMDDAVKLGADVINASFGSAYTEADQPRETAVNNAVKAGVLFSGAEDDIDEYKSENYVGYSPNGDNEADMPAVVAVPLRKLGKTDAAIYDLDENELLRKTDISSDTGEIFYAEKFSETYLYFPQKDINALPDGDYTFKIYGGFYRLQPYEQNESAEFKFYLDRKKRCAVLQILSG